MEAIPTLVGSSFFGCCIVASLIIDLKGRHPHLGRTLNAIGGVIMNALAASDPALPKGLRIIFGVAFIFFAAALFNHWNDWRKRRKKKPNRLLGRVKDIGHRLVVVPESVPQGA